MADGVPEFLQKLMRITRLPQAGLAKRIGVSQGTISKWLRGVHSPNTDQWGRVIGFAQMTPKARHLLPEAFKLATEPRRSVDELIGPYGPEVQESVFGMVEGYLRTLPKPEGRKA